MTVDVLAYLECGSRIQVRSFGTHIIDPPSPYPTVPSKSARNEARLEQEKEDRAQEREKAEDEKLGTVLAAVTQAGFTSLWDFQAALHTTKNQQISAALTRSYRHSNRGTDMLGFLADRIERPLIDEWVSKRFLDVLQREGAALAAMLVPEEGANVSSALARYSLPQLLLDAKEAAPNLVQALSTVLLYKEGDEDSRRKRDVVLANMLSTVAQTRHERASTYQIVASLYLYACGATKSLYEVLNHAGFALSYTSATIKLKELSRERVTELKRLVRTQPCMIAWDNVNIPFRVNEQRVASKDHFDNGTTATLIPLFAVAPGTLPLSLLPPRLTRRITFDFKPETDLLPTRQQIQELETCLLWHLEDLLMQSFPALQKRLENTGTNLAPPMINAIPLHKSAQYPLPAALIDESTIDGTLEVIDHIFFKTLGLNEDEIRQHGIFFTHGDQLTVSLIDSASGSRRDDARLVDNPSKFMKPQFGLFHAKMAGIRCVANEYWGTSGSPAPWSLWKVNSLLGRKPISVGWQAKTPAPYQPVLELITKLALPANILDGYRIHSGKKLDIWIKEITDHASLRLVTLKVFRELCSACRVAMLRKKVDRDVTLENIILFNRDALIFVALQGAVKRGDVGTVVNVLTYWLLMFRGTGKMPKYADILFHHLRDLSQMAPDLRQGSLMNWLVNLSGKANGFKEIELLQDHQNFWLKRWLGIVSVCIFCLRDVIRQVQSNFKTPHNSKSHTSPSTEADLNTLQSHLESQAIQSYTPERPGNRGAVPARDLLAAGTASSNTPTAFKNYREDTQKADFKSTTAAPPTPNPTSDSDASEDEDEDDGNTNDFGSPSGFTEDDLGLDEDEFPIGSDPKEVVALVENLVDTLAGELFE
ncbi:hypothetical protein DFP72DRAFT_992947 [Ephemerocybe angulata]|uniref:DUF6589 domain-containing protein n=1 Tax=Ephemerocybe angulata TaxID=980116 RepID=A0A8H6HF24_9AGAR|nr:hypothetical protein DFP72DRAFT_992947 [Tulosesus angulatus]